jgi:primosomal protein N' (replication factor Y)
MVPVGKREMVGMVMATDVLSDLPNSQLKPVVSVVDETPVFDATMLALCQWAADYYQHPIGMVIHHALPVLLRKGKSAQPPVQIHWQLTEQGAAIDPQSLKNAPRQQQVLNALAGSTSPQSLDKLASTHRAAINTLVKKGWISAVTHSNSEVVWQQDFIVQKPHTTSSEQALAISAIIAGLGTFKVSLLEGVTGSGKTEVYLQAIAEVLQSGKQVLVLVPEIGLTPQTLTRFQQRFALPMAMLHSGLAEGERLRLWQRAKSGELAILIGTRSAVFCPFKRLGMIVVDEEHDLSFKQQDGLRYHARDLAIISARQQNIPLILGSATPSLESLANAFQQKYAHHRLSHRVAGASLTQQHLLDIRNLPLQAGIAKPLLDKIANHLQQGNQVLVFLNRRGYAPALMCHHCGYVEQCNRCDAPFTLHQAQPRLHCHHCGNVRKIPDSCASCGQQQWDTAGIGTEQVEQLFTRLFPKTPPVRIDSDAVRGKGRFETLLTEIRQLKHKLLIGTQILAKGHHFPHVTLVVVLGVDGALYSGDFRAGEKLAQLIVQVAGRAGREHKPGEMWLQTHDPSHPLLQDIVLNGYHHYAKTALQERQYAQLPPYQYQVLIRAEAADLQKVLHFLAVLETLFSGQRHIKVIGPMPALHEKRQGRYRGQLVVQSAHRSVINRLIRSALADISRSTEAKKVRWSVDVDPYDFA